MYTTDRTTELLIFLAIILVVVLCTVNCDELQTDPDIPILVSPINGSTITQNPPTFIWQNIEGDVIYHLQVAENTSFNSIITYGMTYSPDTSFTPTNSFGSGEYFWRVCAQENC